MKTFRTSQGLSASSPPLLTALLVHRIFPSPSTKTDEKNQGGDDEQDEGGEGADGEGDEDKGEEEKVGGKAKAKDGPDPVSTMDKDETTASTQPTVEKKSLQQTYEDILFHVLLSLPLSLPPLPPSPPLIS
jgi:hypothetical protein